MTRPVLSHKRLTRHLARMPPATLAQRWMADPARPTEVSWNQRVFPLVEVLVTQALCDAQVPFAPVLALIEELLQRGAHHDPAGRPDRPLWESLAEKRDIFIKQPDDFLERQAGWSRVLKGWQATGQALDQRDAGDATLLHRAMEHHNLGLATALIQANVPLATASPGSTSIVPLLQTKAHARFEWAALAQEAVHREQAQQRVASLHERPAAPTAPTRRRLRS